jgi:ABC-type Fe3+/spermidine/putrescine transport system ATPase subunit
VTHDQEEAFSLADKVVLLNAGQVEQTGAPQELYCQPASLFTARFLGLTNLLPARVIQQQERRIVETQIGDLPAGNQELGEGTLLIRPDSMRIDHNGSFTLVGQLQEISFRGSIFRAIIEVNGYPLSFDFLSNTKLPQEGDTVVLSFEPEQALQFIPAK